MAEKQELEFIQDNEPTALIAVNSTGGVTLAQAATREKLALWIVRHQREEHDAPVREFYAGMIVVLLLLVIGAALLRLLRHYANPERKRSNAHGSD